MVGNEGDNEQEQGAGEGDGAAGVAHAKLARVHRVLGGVDNHRGGDCGGDEGGTEAGALASEQGRHVVTSGGLGEGAGDGGEPGCETKAGGGEVAGTTSFDEEREGESKHGLGHTNGEEGDVHGGTG